LEALCCEEEFHDVEGRWTFRSGGDCCCCTDSAIKIAKTFCGRVWGYYGKENLSAIIGNGAEAGHDFAILEDRFLVDYWAFRVCGLTDRYFFDLTDLEHIKTGRLLYGSRDTWNVVLFD
jgi:hypothetical protein